MKGTMSIDLEETPGYSSCARKLKRKDQKLVGFALETNDGENYAKDKLAKKNADVIVLNTLSSTTDSNPTRMPLKFSSKMANSTLSAYR